MEPSHDFLSEMKTMDVWSAWSMGVLPFVIQARFQPKTASPVDVSIIYDTLIFFGCVRGGMDIEPDLIEKQLKKTEAILAKSKGGLFDDA